MKNTESLPVVVYAHPSVGRSNSVFTSFAVYQYSSISKLSDLAQSLSMHSDSDEQPYVYRGICSESELIEALSNSGCDVPAVDSDTQEALELLRVKCAKSANLSDVIRRLVQEI